jgi:Carboxypeptidase regulatory-like domain
MGHIGAIKGLVRDADDVPIEDINIVILDGSNLQDIAAMTGADGTFGFSGLQAGNYVIKAFGIEVESDDIPVRVLPRKIAFVEVWLETDRVEKQDYVVDEMY